MRALIVACCPFAACCAFAAFAQDWPQWGGPDRNFRVQSPPLATKWPASGPKKLWSRPLGEGYSSIVASGDVLYTMYRKGSQDVVIALDANTGKTVWESPIDASHRSGMGMEHGAGPHSTPLVSADRVFVTTITAQLHALERKTGKRIWSHDLWKEYDGTFLDRGYSSSPIAYRDTIIVPVGGAGRALMAFRQKDGGVVWKGGGNFENGQASPLLIQVDGREQLVTFMAKHVIGNDPATGKLLWSVPHPTMYDVNAATPAWCDDSRILVVSSAYNGGARGIQVGGTAKELWSHKRLRVHHGNMVCINGVVYGSSGDFGPAPLTAVDAKTGQVLWQDRAFAKANFAYADGKLIVVDEDGTVALATVSRDGMKVLAQARLLQRNAWTAPALAGTRLYVRDRRNIMALSLSP